MAPSVYTISFVLEKIHRKYAQNFILSLRFEGHEWCNVGQFDDSDLPIGFMFTTILSSFSSADKFKIEINVSTNSSFLACLHFSKNIGADVLLSRGLSILYSKDHENSVMAITIAVKIAKYYNSPTTENVISKQECEAQTDRTEMRTAQTQVRRRCKTTGSNTELHLISASELEEAVANIVAEHLANTKDIKTNDETARDFRMPPSSPIQPAPTSCRSNDLQLGKNIIPRLQKLKVLDKMITERTALVGQFDASLVKIELARKREFILKSRRMSVSIPRTGITDARTSPEMLTRVKSPQKRDTRDVAIQAEKLLSPAVSVQSSSSTPSGSNSSTSGTSDEETESERRETNESESASSTTSSTSSSKETIVRKKSTASSNSHSSAEQTKSPSEVLTRSKPERTTEEPLSPTSLYLKQLREKILQERLQKI